MHVDEDLHKERRTGEEGVYRTEDVDESSNSGIGRTSLAVPGEGEGAYFQKGTIAANVDDPAARSQGYGGQEKFQA